jgi:glycosyltransferase involved in cell wall biosynthesis
VPAPQFRVDPASPPPRPAGGSLVHTAGRAVRQKLRLLSAYGNLWPAAGRGLRLVARGRLREFGRKLFREWADAGPDVPAGSRPGPPLVLGGHVLTLGGYDHVAFAVLRALATRGVNLLRDRRAIFNPDIVPPPLQPLRARRTTEPRLVVFPPHLVGRFRPDRLTAVFTMWETDSLPAAAVRALNRSGLVLVPSRWGVECFRANGVTVPLEVVPLGHDPGVFNPADDPRSGYPDPAARQTQTTSCRVYPGGLPPCTFGTAGALDQGGLRKNVPRVVGLFRRAFPAEPGVRLRVKVSPASPPVETHGDPRVEVIRTSLPPGELADWYNSLTAFVNGSFGEGFGLHLLEAMACGVPLISTTFGGVGEFFDASVGYEVGYDLIPARNAIYGGRWADPHDADLVRAMREVHAARGVARELGARAAVRATAFTWADTGRRLAAALARHGFLPSAGHHQHDGGE